VLNWRIDLEPRLGLGGVVPGWSEGEMCYGLQCVAVHCAGVKPRNEVRYIGLACREL